VGCDIPNYDAYVEVSRNLALGCGKKQGASCGEETHPKPTSNLINIVPTPQLEEGSILQTGRCRTH
jgi:hypothetical protein